MKKLIIANWKLNPETVGEAKKLALKLDTKPKHEAVVCPPAPFLVLNLYPRLGAQDCFWQTKGPYTGQISPATLKSLKVKYCLVGHSEKRELGETEDQTKKKLTALLSLGITPVLCVGFNTKVDDDDLAAIDILKEQLKFALFGLSEKDLNKIIVAYEPVWAISHGNPYATKKMATPEHAVKVAIFLKTKFSIKKVLYGGSVNAFNAKSFLSESILDGLLLGGASLLPKDFNEIINLTL